MLNKQGVSKPTQSWGKTWQNTTKYLLKYGQHNLKMLLNTWGLNGPFQGEQGEGVALSFLGPQGTILTSEIPQDFSGEDAQTLWSRSSHKIAQNKGQTRVKRGQTTPKLKTLLTNYLEQAKSELLYVIC